MDHTFGIMNSLFKALQPNGRFNDILVASDDSLMKILLPRTGAMEHELTEHRVAVFKGSMCGVIPIAGPCLVSTFGLRWDLQNSRLGFGTVISTSNVAVSDEVVLRSDGAILWCMTAPCTQQRPVSP